MLHLFLSPLSYWCNSFWSFWSLHGADCSQEGGCRRDCPGAGRGEGRGEAAKDVDRESKTTPIFSRCGWRMVPRAPASASCGPQGTARGMGSDSASGGIGVGA